MRHNKVNFAIRIFPFAFLDCQALFAFDKAANHACFAENFLLPKQMNLGVSEEQTWMRDGFSNAM